MRRLTKDEFIAKARAVHGDKYDYSKVKYVNNSTKVEIICPVHGSFFQAPQKHMAGRACPHMDCINARREATTMAHYGVKNSMKSDIVKQNLKETNEKRYGVSNVMQTGSVKEKQKQTVREKYGVDCSFQADSVKAKRRRTFTEKYGGNSPMLSPDVRAKAAETMKRKYGAESPLKSSELLQKARDTVKEHYGVDNPMFSSEIKNKVIDTKRRNNTFNVSKPENKLYDMLCNTFGKDNVLRQYRSDDYPFACDFYIKSRDMYVELNATWMHNSCWFDRENVSHCGIVNDWSNKSGSNPQYATAVYTWTDLDVRKRNTAHNNKLNYIVFWDNGLRDAKLWFSMGCPDGRDWEKEYSWINSVTL